MRARERGECQHLGLRFVHERSEFGEPLGELVAFGAPPNDRVEVFYDESERLVRFLAQTDQARFLVLLETIAKGDAFAPALLHNYAGVFANSADCETKFCAYVSEDSATTMQDQQ